MGNCNNSKDKDIQQERARAPQNKNSQTNTSSPSKAISVRGDAGGPVDPIRSYTDKRQQESDLLSDLVQKTSRVLIDVSAESQLDKQQTEKLESDYRQRNFVNDISVPAKIPFFLIPTPSESVPEALEDPSFLGDISNKDKDMASKCCDSIVSAFSSMEITNVESLVVMFGSTMK
eukprot:CAMPEP_0174259090 /NCGR_PEP_ID=MMETSP0439-20130205/7977_1 /TAXON_ID=0 /ORGANISM="Stereomyxa ramosa, Strain Chinc5" /LENGTH=174 /DNA_ID=CAMNT_0015342857 /DNA_START=40 /DNA_END=564 /DNA_ORIENTATION=+